MTTLRRAMAIDADNPVEGDLYISTTGQLVFTRGEPQTRDLEVRQHVRGRLRMFLAEWFLDARRGFPYFRDVFIKGPNHPSILASMRRTIRETPGVDHVDRLTLAVDSDRRARIDFRAILSDSGAVLLFEDFIIGEF